jgi:protein-tyrosine phosphatase
VGLFAIITSVTIAARYVRKHIMWDNFGVVQSGKIYRSGQLKPRQLNEAIRRYRLRSVLNLHHNRIGNGAAEAQLMRDMGVKYYCTAWPGNGVVAESHLRWAYEIISDQANQPILVHCARGTNRTGAVVAYYRIYHSKWSRERIRDEMVRHRHRPHSNLELENMVDQLCRTPIQTASHHDAIDIVPQLFVK